MKKKLLTIFFIAIIMLTTPLPVKACGNGRAPLISITKRLPSTVTIYDPMKSKYKGKKKKPEKAIIKNEKIVFKDGKKYKLKPQFRGLLPEGSVVMVYKKGNRITKIIFKEK